MTHFYNTRESQQPFAQEFEALCKEQNISLNQREDWLPWYHFFLAGWCAKTQQVARAMIAEAKERQRG